MPISSEKRSITDAKRIVMMEAVGNSILEELKSYVHSALNDENTRVFFL